MDEYPDPDEEYELMYADELELLRDEDDQNQSNRRNRALPAKRSLDFSSPVAQKSTKVTPVVANHRNNSVTNTEILTPQPLEELPTNVSNKRTVDDLFGDIGDIDLDDIQLPSKKQKTDEENDLELISKILEARKLRQALLEPSGGKIDSKSNYDVKDNLSIDIPKWPFVPITNSDGDRIYVRLESEESWGKNLDSMNEQISLKTSFAKTWEEARKILEAKQEQLSQPPEVELVDVTSNNLWVEKYKPHSYVDLLSEEPINRALLHWLHLWDKVVFKKEVKTKEPQQRTAFSKRSGQFQLNNKWKGKKESEPELDEDGRPHHKVALLCGPPGVGKTTLAHLLAKLAGYRPVELNASDERSTEAFSNALKSATLMRSVIDAEKRPNCLILDEIDGAPLPTVELLVKWCTATTETGKKKAKSQPLKRPVIAICNDLYAPSLRPLRLVSLILHVGGVSLSRLTSRLALVSEREGMTVAPHVAATLAARAQGDVRAAIQLLSFIKAKAKEQLNMADVENAMIGTKDCSQTMMQTLQTVFIQKDEDNSTVLKKIQAAGEYDKVIEGIFENYLESRVDARLLIACETLSWLQFYDEIQSWTQRNQNYALYGVVPLCVLRCRSVLATRTQFRVKFPSQLQEVSRRKAELSSILWSVWRGSGLHVSSRSAALLDLLPLLPYLLTPKLRSPNVQLCSENERNSLRSCARAMCDYGLQYVQQRTDNGLYEFVLEPNIYKLAFFGNEERTRPPPAIRQAIAREQHLEMIRRNEEMMNRTSGSKLTTSNKTNKTDQESTFSKEKDLKVPNHMQRLRPKEVEKAPQVYKDFFGRVVPISHSQRSGAVPDVISSSRVFYQYREGYNNAVRKNVRMKDLL